MMSSRLAGPVRVWRTGWGWCIVGGCDDFLFPPLLDKLLFNCGGYYIIIFREVKGSFGEMD